MILAHRQRGTRYGVGAALLGVLIIAILLAGRAVPSATASGGRVVATPVAAYHFKSDDLRFHGGPVIPYSTSYAIFWRPPGTRYEPQGSDTQYMHLMKRYLRDVGGTPFFNILTQYSYGPAGSRTLNRRALRTRPYTRLVPMGPIRNQSQFGGAYLDTSPYPRAGTTGDPILYPDFLTVVRRAMKARGWHAGLTHVFYLFIAGGPRACFVGRTQCLPSDGCATHVSYGTKQHPVVVDILADVAAYANCRSPESAGKYAHRSVNHDTIADFEVTILSHEQFETITDPLDGNSVTPVRTNAWYDRTPADGEIADKCESILDAILSAGLDNVRLHGHRYHVQEEWSDVTHSCVTRYPKRHT